MKTGVKSSKKDSLGNRMKKYEAVNRNFLIPKMNTIIRIDGKAFHTYTQQFKKPFDQDLINAMDQTAIYLCSKIQGAKFAFVQSDEISILVTDYDTIETSSWFDGNIQKIVSVSASMATTQFNKTRLIQSCGDHSDDDREPNISKEEIEKFVFAEFDSRVFQVPSKEEVVNCFLWRQQDATRNSIQSVGQTYFSQQELDCVSTNEIQEMLFQKKGINWNNDFEPKLRRGRFIMKHTYINGKRVYMVGDKWYIPCDGEEGVMPDLISIEPEDKVRTKWESVECPIFSKDRQFLLSKMPKEL